MNYYFGFIQGKSMLSLLINIFIVSLAWELCFFYFFDRAIPYIPLLLYDLIVVSMIGSALGYYIFKNYYKYLEKYKYILTILYLLSVLWLLYTMYKYNTDLSNLTGVVVF